MKASKKKKNIKRNYLSLKIRKRKSESKRALKKEKSENHRLIERGAILESLIEGASEKSNEEIKAILQRAFQKD